MILLLGAHSDPHIRSVSHELAQMGVEALIVDHTDRAPITIDIANGSLAVAGHSVAMDNIKLAWYRSKFEYALFGSGDEFRNEYVAANAWRDTLRALWALLGERAVNSYISVQRASVKVDQLVTAAALGFAVPRTIVSNSYEDILNWESGRPTSIIKAIESATIPDLTMPFGYSSMMTTRIDWDLFRSDREAIAVAPTLFQGEVKKAFELRIAVQGDSVFASRIDPSSKPYMEVDWRYGSAICEYAPFILPDDVIAKLHSYLAYYGLYSGQFDFAVDPDGVYWFLECNPQGFWAFLDEGWGFEVSKGFAADLKNLYQSMSATPTCTAAAIASRNNASEMAFESRQ